MTPATRLLALITAHFGTIETTAQDPLDAQILRDLHPDSLDLIEIMMEIEDQFHITLTDEEAMDMPEDATLRDLWEKIEAKLLPLPAPQE